MPQLFNRVAEVTITPPDGVVGKLFSCPPFAMEFDQKIAVGSQTTTTLKLINPNMDTINASTPKLINGITKGAEVVISAGYEGSYGTCCVGEAYVQKIQKANTEVTMSLEITDQTSVWSDALVSKSWQNQPASKIIKEMCSLIGLNAGNIVLGVDKTYPSCTCKQPFSQIVKWMCEDTKSEYYFQNGVFYIQPVQPASKKSVQYLSPATGLIGIPEPTTTNGIKSVKFQTLFFYNLNAGDYIQIDSAEFKKATARIMNGTKKFSTYGSSLCDFEAQLI